MRRPHAALSRQAGPGQAPAIRLPASLLAGIVIGLLLMAPGAPCRAADDAGRQGALLVTPRDGAGDRGSVPSPGTEAVSSAARQRLLDVDRLEKACAAVGFRLVVLGEAPEVPVMVHVRMTDRPWLSIIRAIGRQTGTGQRVRLLEAARVVELAYLDGGSAGAR